MTIDQRLELAAAARREGLNCSQSIMRAFPDVHGLSADATDALAIGLGGGVGGSGAECGAITAMAVLTGAAAYRVPADKRAIYGDVQQLRSRFAGANGGLTECRWLRVPGGKSCNELIQDAVRLLHNYLEAHA